MDGLTTANYLMLHGGRGHGRCTSFQDYSQFQKLHVLTYLIDRFRSPCLGLGHSRSSIYLISLQCIRSPNSPSEAARQDNILSRRKNYYSCVCGKVLGVLLSPGCCTKILLYLITVVERTEHEV